MYFLAGIPIGFWLILYEHHGIMQLTLVADNNNNKHLLQLQQQQQQQQV